MCCLTCVRDGVSRIWSRNVHTLSGCCLTSAWEGSLFALLHSFLWVVNSHLKLYVGFSLPLVILSVRKKCFPNCFSVPILGGMFPKCFLKCRGAVSLLSQKKCSTEVKYGLTAEVLVAQIHQLCRRFLLSKTVKTNRKWSHMYISVSSPTCNAQRVCFNA